MNNKLLLIFLVSVLSLLLAGWLFKRTAAPVPPGGDGQRWPRPEAVGPSSGATGVDERAYFAIFTNGTFRVFTAAMYHQRSADVYLTAENPNEIKVKRANQTWGDFFKTLPFSLTHGCLVTGTQQTFCNGSTASLKFYLNGQRRDEFLNRAIKNGDRLLVSFGPTDDLRIESQLLKLNSF